jgi:predicted nucleotidyltransferase
MVNNVGFIQFNANLNEPFSLIHPLHVNHVKNLINSPIPNYIDYIFLFGSSLDYTCQTQSDIDLYIISDAVEESVVYDYFYKTCRKLGFRFDILVSDLSSFLSESKRINAVEKQVWDHGVVLYEKKNRNPAG